MIERLRNVGRLLRARPGPSNTGILAQFAIPAAAVRIKPNQSGRRVGRLPAKPGRARPVYNAASPLITRICRMSLLKIPFCLLFVFLAHAALAWYQNQPQAAGPDVPSGKLRSLSFAPYHAGFSPIAQKFPLPEHIEHDARLIADKTYTIRTYSVRGGMQPTPDYARQYGLDMMMGAWLGDGHPENRVEIQTLIQAANQHADVVKRVIVGNEVLLRKDMDIDTLIGYIRQVKQAVQQPVTYADVWSSYLQYPQLFREVDFITIHILPYWEDEPVAIEHAAEHVEKIVRQIEDKAHSMGVDKPILIGESGWPSVGRQRGAAVPGVVNSARYIRDLIQVANRHGFDYNIVEAFNQPGKAITKAWSAPIGACSTSTASRYFR